MAFSSIFKGGRGQPSLRTDGGAGNLWDAVLKCGEPPSRGPKAALCIPVVYSQRIRNDGELCCDETLVDVLHTIAKPTGQRTGLLDLALESIAKDSRTLVISQEESAPTPLVAMQPDKARTNERAAIKVTEKHIVNVFNVRKKGVADLQPISKMWVTAAYRVSSPINSPGHYLLSDLKLEVGSFADGQTRTLDTQKSEFYTPPKQQGEKQVVENDNAVEKYCANLLSERTNNIPSIRDIPKRPSCKLKQEADTVMRDRGKTPWELIRSDVKYDFAEEGDAQMVNAQIAPADKMQLHCVALLGGIQCDPKLVNILRYTLKPTTERGRLLDFLESCVQGTNIKISAAGITKNPATIVHPITMSNSSASAVRVTEAHCVKVMRKKLTGGMGCIGALEAIVQFTLFTTEGDPDKCKLGDLRVVVKPINSAGRATRDQLTHNSTYTCNLPINPAELHGYTRLGEDKFHVPYTQDVVLPENRTGILPTSRVKLKRKADTAMCNVAKTPWDLIKTGVPYGTPSNQPGAHSKLRLLDNIGRGIGPIPRDEQMVEFARSVVQPTSIRPGLLKFLEKCIDSNNPSMRVIAHSSYEPSLTATLTYVTEDVTFPMVKVEEVHLVDVIDINGGSQRAGDVLVGKPDGISVQDVLQVKLSYEISHHSPHYLIKNMRAEIISMGQNGNKPQENPLVVNINARYHHDEILERNSMQQPTAELKAKASAALGLTARGQPAVSVSSAGGKTGVDGETPPIMLKSAPDQTMRDLARTPWDLICAGDEHTNVSAETPPNDNVAKFTKEYLLKPTKHREGLLEFARACVQDGSELDMATRSPKIEVDVEQDENGLPVSPMAVREEHSIRISRDSEVLGFLVVQVDYKVNETTIDGEYALSDMKVVVRLLGNDGKVSSTPELKYNIKASECVSRSGPTRYTTRQSAAKILRPEHHEQEDDKAVLREKSKAALKKTAKTRVEKTPPDSIALADPEDCKWLVHEHGLCELILGEAWVNTHVDVNAGTASGSTPLPTDRQLALLSAVLDTKPGDTHALLLSALAKCISTSGVTLETGPVEAKRRNIVNSEDAAAVKVEEKHNVKAIWRSAAGEQTKDLGNVNATLSYLISADKTARDVIIISDVELNVAVEGTNIRQDISFDGTEIVTVSDKLLQAAKSETGAKSKKDTESGENTKPVERAMENLHHKIEDGFKTIAGGARDITDALSEGVQRHSRELAEGAKQRIPLVQPAGISLANPNDCRKLVNECGLCEFVLGEDWTAKHMNDSGTTPNLENLGTDEQFILLSTVLDTKSHGTHTLLLSALAKCISTSGVTLEAGSVKAKRWNIVNGEDAPAVRVEETHNVKAIWSAITGGQTKDLGNVNATLSYTISTGKPTQNVIMSDVELHVAVAETDIEQDISFDGTATVTVSNKVLRDVADKLRGHDPNEEYEQELEMNIADGKRASSSTQAAQRSATTTRAKQSASTETAQSDIESGFKAIADEAKDITNALSEDVKQHNQNLSTRQAAQRSTAHTKQSASTGNTAAADQGNETATSPSPSTEGDGSAIQSGSVQHATGSSATLKLKSAPDQAMRDAVPSPWSLINAGEHHSNNSRNAKSGDIREFCSKYLCRGTDKREGLLNFIKASIDTPTSIEVVKGNDTKLRMRVVGPTSSDPSQVTSVVLTETHDFVVRGTNNKEVGTLEAEVQYTVTPTIEQDKYKVSNLKVKIKSGSSELTYNSTNTSEVSLPKPEAVTSRSRKPLTSSDAVTKLAGASGTSLEQRVAAAVSALTTTRIGTDPQQSANMAEYLDGISTPSSSVGTEAASGTTTARDSKQGSAQHSTTVPSQPTINEQPSPQLKASTKGASMPARPACELKKKEDQVMRSAAATPWSLIYGEHEPTTPEAGTSSDIQDFLKKFLLKPTKRRKGLLEFAKACMYDGGSLSTHATNGPKITLKISDDATTSTVEEVHNIQVKDAQQKTVDVLAVKVSYNVSGTDTQGKYSLSDLSVVVKSLGREGDSPSDTELSYEISKSQSVSWQKQPKFNQYVVPALSATNNAQQNDQDNQEKLRARATEALLLAAQQDSAPSNAKSIATQTGGVSAPPSQLVLHSNPECSDIHDPGNLSRLVLGEEWFIEHDEREDPQYAKPTVGNIFSDRDAQHLLLSAVLDTAPKVTNGCLLDALQNSIGTQEVVLVASQDVVPVVTVQNTNKGGSSAILVQEEHEAIAKHLSGSANLKSSDVLRSAVTARDLGKVNAILSYTMSTNTTNNDVYVVISDVKLVVAVLDINAAQTIEFKNAEDKFRITGKLLQDVVENVEKLRGRASVGTQSEDVGEGIGHGGGTVLYASTTASKADSDETERHLAAGGSYSEASDDEDDTRPAVDTAAGKKGRAQRGKAAGKALSSTKAASDDEETPTRGDSGTLRAKQDDIIDSDTDSEAEEPSPARAKRPTKARRRAATTLQVEEQRSAGSGTHDTDGEGEEPDTDDDYEEHPDEQDLLEEYEEDNREKSGVARIAKLAQHHIRSGGTHHAERVSDTSEAWHQTQRSAHTVIKKAQLFAHNGRFNFVDEVRNALRHDLLCQEIFYPTDDAASFETNLLMRIAEASVAPLGGPEAAENLQIVGSVKSEVDFSEPQQEYDVVKGATIDAGIHGTFYISVQYQVAREVSVYSTNYVIKNAAIHLGRNAGSGTTVLPIDDIVSIVDTPWSAASAEYKKQKSIFRTGAASGGSAQKSGVKQEKKHTQQKQQFIPEFTEENALHTVPTSTEKRGWFSKILGFVCKFFGKILKFLRNLLGARSTAHDNFAKYEIDTSEFIEDKPSDLHTAHLSRISDNVRHNAQAEVDTMHSDAYDDDIEYPARYDPAHSLPSEVVSDSTIHPAGVRTTAARKGRR